MRPIAMIFAAAVLVLGVAAGWLIAAKTISWIEAGERAELEQAFYAGGIDWATAEPDGFLVVLAGTAPSAADQARAVKISQLIFGENLIDQTTSQDAGVELAEAEPPFIEILKNGSSYSLIGKLPQGQTTEILTGFIATLGENETLSDVTEPIENEPENWVESFEFGLRLASLTEQSILNITPGSVSLEAVADSENWQQGFEEMAEKLRPEGVELSVQLSTPRPVISPYIFAIDVANPSEAICSAQDEVEAGLIYDNVVETIGLSVKCSIGIGAPSRYWREAVEGGVQALAGFGGGQLQITDAEVSLVAPIGMSESDFEQITQRLRLALPDGFSLKATRPPAPPRRATEEARPVEFIVTLAPEGGVVIEGSVKDKLTREVVMRFSEAKFGYGRVEDQLWLEDSLPDGWQVRVFSMIEALALLNEGRAEMSPAALTITGDASIEDASGELGKLLEQGYDPAELTLDLSYSAPSETDGGQSLDPRLCVSRITKLLSENSIVFAPSSATISDPSLPTIAAIAEILTRCRDANIEVGGHTDSQGGEDMNRALSQSRADAVVDGLISQNLLLGNLSAKGYGESEPIASNETEEGRAQNRRIEFKLIREMPEADPPAATQRIVIENFRRPAFRARQTPEPSQ